MQKGRLLPPSRQLPHEAGAPDKGAARLGRPGLPRPADDLTDHPVQNFRLLHPRAVTLPARSTQAGVTLKIWCLFANASILTRVGGAGSQYGLTVPACKANDRVYG